MGSVAIGFGLASAAVLVIAALFSTRHNRNVAAFAVIMWAATKVWDYRTGTDAQIYLDSALALLCGLMCVHVMAKDRRSRWPLVVLSTMVAWEFLNAAYSEPGRDYEPQVSWTYQLAKNVLYAIALIALASPGIRRGTLALLRSLGAYPVRRARPSLGSGWGREAPNAFSKREPKSR